MTGTLTHPERLHRRREIATAIREGYSVESVCERFGVSMVTVRDACREAGVRVPGLKKIGGQTYAILAALLNTSDTYDQIAERFGVTKQRVGQIALNAKAAGIRFLGR